MRIGEIPGIARTPQAEALIAFLQAEWLLAQIERPLALRAEALAEVLQASAGLPHPKREVEPVAQG